MKPPADDAPLGIFGGTFDPVHVGHLRLAEEAAEALALSGVRWIPAGQPKHREAPSVTGEHRLRMVERAIAGNPRFALDGSEIAANASYTVPTLERLRRELGPTRPLVLLLGADAFAGLPGWHRWRDLFALAHLGVAHRPGYPLDPANMDNELAQVFAARRVADPAELATSASGRICCFAMTQLAVSATQLRALLANRQSPRYLLPQAVIDYIDANNLYRNPDLPSNGY